MQHVLYHFLKNLTKGCGIKILLTAVSTRSLAKVIAQMTTGVPRYGLAIGLMSLLFQLTMCLLVRLRRRLNL